MKPYIVILNIIHKKTNYAFLSSYGTYAENKKMAYKTVLNDLDLSGVIVTDYKVMNSKIKCFHIETSEKGRRK